MRGGLCIRPDQPGWGLLLMVVNALSAEAAGRCFRAWRLMARLPGGKKDGQLARHMARFRWMEGVGDSPPLGNVPPSDMRGAGVVSRCREKDLAGEASFA